MTTPVAAVTEVPGLRTSLTSHARARSVIHETVTSVTGPGTRDKGRNPLLQLLPVLRALQPNKAGRSRPSFLAFFRVRLDLRAGLAEHLRAAAFRGMEA